MSITKLGKKMGLKVSMHSFRRTSAAQMLAPVWTWTQRHGALVTPNGSCCVTTFSELMTVPSQLPTP